MNTKTFPELVANELARARSLHKGNFASLHEGYAVIKEELDEFWDQVKTKSENRSYDKILNELVQVAAMAQRTAEEVVMPGNRR